MGLAIDVLGQPRVACEELQGADAKMRQFFSCFYHMFLDIHIFIHI